MLEFLLLRADFSKPLAIQLLHHTARAFDRSCVDFFRMTDERNRDLYSFNPGWIKDNQLYAHKCWISDPQHSTFDRSQWAGHVTGLCQQISRRNQYHSVCKRLKSWFGLALDVIISRLIPISAEKLDCLQLPTEIRYSLSRKDSAKFTIHAIGDYHTSFWLKRG